MFTMHVLNNWALDYVDLVEGSEDWLDIPIVTGESESGEVVVLARVRNCMPVWKNDSSTERDGNWSSTQKEGGRKGKRSWNNKVRNERDLTRMV